MLTANALAFAFKVAVVAAAGSASGDAAPPAHDAALRKQLTAEQYAVTQQCSTEPPFHNAYWDNHEDGIYVDVISGEPLFSSLDKFDSGTGWPSFTRPLGENLVTRTDKTLGMERTEVRTKDSNSHLGHLFDDGPGPTGMRYCINSASLKFVPLDKLKAAGFSRYLFLFADKRHWQVATLAGGCFWGMEEIFEKQPGVLATQVGYTGGTTKDPTYHQVSTGTTGHAESLQVLFDPTKTSYESLLLLFFRMHDPTTKDRQANDVGSQYRSAIFYATPEQKRVAEAVKTRAALSGAWKKPVVTEIAPLGPFYRAEDYHQGYLDAHPDGYRCHVVRDLDFGSK